MGQKITDEGTCEYCGDCKKGVHSKHLHSAYEDTLLEIHCNRCGASWDPEGEPRAVPYNEGKDAAWFRDLK
jgi:hypothetical protein